MAWRNCSQSTGSAAAFISRNENTGSGNGIPSNILLYSDNRKDSHMDTGLLLIRLVIGLVMAAHGAQKLFGWFGGYGVAGTGGFFETIGFRPRKLFAALARLGEVRGGLLHARGFLRSLGGELS